MHQVERRFCRGSAVTNEAFLTCPGDCFQFAVGCPQVDTSPIHFRNIHVASIIEVDAERVRVIQRIRFHREFHAR